MLATGIALVTVMVFRLDFNRLLYEIEFPFMALGYVAFIVLGADAVGGTLIHETGNRFVILINWALSAWIINQKDLSADWVYPCVMVSYLAGRQAGVAAGSFDAFSMNAVLQS